MELIKVPHQILLFSCVFQWFSSKCYKFYNNYVLSYTSRLEVGSAILLKCKTTILYYWMVRSKLQQTIADNAKTRPHRILICVTASIRTHFSETKRSYGSLQKASRHQTLNLWHSTQRRCCFQCITGYHRTHLNINLFTPIKSKPCRKNH
jgi:hypothetical protein